MSILARANRRHFLRHPLQLLLAVFGVALGVAMVVSIDLAAASTHRAFALSMDALTGRYTHHLSAGPVGLPEDAYVALRRAAADIASAPAIEGYAETAAGTVRLVGFDPFAERSSQSRFIEAAKGDAAMRLLTEADAVLLSAVSGRRLGVGPGGVLNVNINGQPHALKVVAYIEGQGTPDPALEGLLLADIATAQELLGRLGVLDRIDLILPDAQAVQRIRALLPPGAELEAAAGRSAATQNMTAAFELNLRAMSLLALLVGAFLIYNTMAFSVLQRRELLAALRILGATRGQLLREIVLEAALLGLLGGVLGLAFGLLAAQSLLHMVTRTINDLYFVLTVTEFMPDPLALLRGLGLGVAAAVLAALGPALEAAWTKPIAARARSGAETSVRRALPGLAVAGLLAMLAALALLNADSAGLAAAIAGVFLLLFGYGLLVPWLLLGLSAAATWLANWGGAWLLRLAVRGVAASVSRAGLAIAALCIAIAVGIGVGTMIDSFRGTIADWLGQILQADIYVATPSTAARHSPPLPDGLEAQLQKIPGVAATGSGRRVFVNTSVGDSEVLALNPPPGPPGFRFQHADSHALWAAFPSMDAVFISEPYAHKHGLRVGDRIELAADRGPTALPVAGIFFDYRSDQGLIVMHRHLYEKLWQDRLHTSVGLYLAPGADLPAVRAAVERLLADIRQPMVVRSNREIRDASLATFERTFAITQVLRLLAVGVAFVGILSALLAFQYERRRELAVLCATGLTPAQTGGLVLLQTGFMGLAAGLLALPLGLAVALALVRVINLRSFGWTMDLNVAAPPLLAAVLLAVIAALLAGLYPARQAMRTPPAVSLREE
ncbi:MAG: ABC transporter permease [Candidatus Methylumidiphilus sp.]